MTNIKKFVAIGHVDTGKSCLCGHLLYKCGFIDEHSMNKIKEKAIKEKMGKWVWSRVLDIYEEEMLRGKTHEFNLVNFNYNNKDYQLIDTPGHQTYVRSMIEGLSQNVNICMLLISMIPNEFESSFEKGMLKEHLILARSLDIRFIILVGNKMDAIDWDSEIYNKSIEKIKRFLKSIQWRDKCIRDIPISAYQGTGLVNTDGMPQWYLKKNNKCLLNILDEIPVSKYKIFENEQDLKSIKQFIIEIRILNLEEGVITPGFIFNCHYKGEEIEMKILKMKSNMESKITKIFAKQGEKIVAIVETTEKIKISEDCKLIYRKNNYTIGFGKILKIKS
jgi:elongation factor 1-alpha